MEGWICLHRKMLDWEWYSDSNTFRLFIHLLLLANHEEKKWKGQVIKRGQLITSSEHLAKDLKLSRQQIRTSINKLKSTNEITTESTNRFLLITIEKYSEYQDKQKENNQLNNQQLNNQITNKQPTNNQQITTNNNITNKQIYKKNNNKQKKFDDVFNEKCFSKELENTLREFIAMRKAIKKPMTTKALELLIRNLDRLTNSEAEKIEILNQSIEHSWQTVYPLKKDSIKTEIKPKEEKKAVDTSKLTQDEYIALMRKEITIEELIKKGRVNVL